MGFEQMVQTYGIVSALWGLVIVLAGIGFRGLRDLGRLEGKIEAVDQRVTQVELRLVERMNHLDERLSIWATQFDKRLDRVESKLDQLLAK